jgi:hypothetical protein
MSLAILSNSLSSQEETFKNIMFAALKANLFGAISENALRSNGSIRDINLRWYFGNKEDDFEYFLMDVHDKDWSEEAHADGTFQKDGIKYYLLAGTDNAPSRLCYDFSLAYLRLCPEHLICIYDWIFTLEDIERIEKETGWFNAWYNNKKNNNK